MFKYKEIFPKKSALLIVIHAETKEQAERNAKIAKDAGADGIFLINHEIARDELVSIYNYIHQKFLGWWIGCNFLGAKPYETILKVPISVSGIWTDNAGINEYLEKPAAEAESVWNARKTLRSSWEGLYFGGVAFKYQPAVNNLKHISRLATKYMDAITTSGEGTGIAPGIEKISAMRKAIGDFPLAIASGITPENASQYVGLADCFIVATGVSNSFTELNAEKVKKLAETLNQ
ncbi:MAG: BtpA/SgcQ family protein [Candidatus Pacebacteria bacterium]|nr:BtpA/SgcQ family protein [Candidatus Paceibacterota bacterium]